MTERQPPPQEGFGFTERERLFDRVSDARFRQLVSDQRTTIHRLVISGNNYGEFVFVTASRPSGAGRECICFWGMGYHEYRERWLADEWFFYRADPFPEVMRQVLPKADLGKLLQARREEIAPYVGQTRQSRRGQLFEMLADMADEDAAYSEMADLGALLDDLEDL